MLKDEIAAAKTKMMEAGSDPALREIFGKRIDNAVEMLARMAAGEPIGAGGGDARTADLSPSERGVELRTIIVDVLNRPGVDGRITENELLDTILEEDLFWPPANFESGKEGQEMRGKRMKTLRQSISAPASRSYFHRLGEQIVLGPPKDEPDMPIIGG